MNEAKVTSESKEDFDKRMEKVDNIRPTRLAGTLSNLFSISSTIAGDNPWTAEDVDKFAGKDVTKEYREIVDSCRFFYRKDPIASVVLNKMSEIAITELRLIKGKTPVNQLRVYESLLDDLQDYAEDAALEYLISGLIVPEVDFTTVTKKELTLRGIKSLQSLRLPTSMWLRDPKTIIINSPLVAGIPSYYLEIPEDIKFFIKNGGKYDDGTEDKELYLEIVKLYPDFVTAILNNETKILPKTCN